MELAIPKASFFKNLIKAFDGVVSEFLLVCDKNGVSYTGMDSNQVVIVALQLKADVFCRYIFNPPQTATREELLLGVSQPLLSKFLQIIPDDSQLVIQDGGDRLKLFAEDNTGVDFQCDVGILELHREFHELPPSTQYQVNIMFPSKLLASCIKDLANIKADHISFRVVPAVKKTTQMATQSSSGLFGDANDDDDDEFVTPAKLLVEGSSTTGAVSITFLAGCDGFGVWSADEEIEQTFPLNFLKVYAVKFASLCDSVQVSLGGGSVPLSLRFPLSRLMSNTKYDDVDVDDENDVEAPHMKEARLKREARDARAAANSSEPILISESMSFVAFYIGGLVRQSRHDLLSGNNEILKEETNTQIENVDANAMTDDVVMT